MWLVIGSIYGFLSVAFGAFGAHALRSQPNMDARMLEIFQTGSHYQMTHALALLAIGVLAELHPGRSYFVPGLLFAVGTAVFSGSLYLLVLTGTKTWGAVTPVGGLLLLGGWIAFAVTALRTLK